MKLEILKKFVGIILLLVAVPFGVLQIALSMIVYNVFAQVINSAPNKKLLEYSYFEQLKDIFPFLGSSIIISFCVSFVSYLNLYPIFTIISQVILGGIMYVLIAYVLKISIFFEILDQIKLFMPKKRVTVDGNNN